MDRTGTMQSSTKLYDYTLFDSEHNKIGTIDGVWVDDATDQPEFVSAKSGWIFGKDHLVPVANAQIDDANGTITVPYSADQIKNSPSFATDAELTPDDESQIYDYYGMQRSTAPSPTGLPPGGQQPGTYGTAGAQTDERSMKVSEEELQVGKRPVEAGQVHLRKVVRTEQQEVPVELRREEVEVERVPASGQEVPDSAFQEQEINVPVMREEPVVGKEARVTGEVRVGKTAETETRTVGGEVRKEDVEIDKNTDEDILNRGGGA